MPLFSVKYRLLCSALVLVSGAANFAYAQTTALASGPLDLLQAWRGAQNYDATYAAALAQRIATAEKAPQGLAGLLPTIGLSGSSLRIDGRSRADGSDAVSRNYNQHSYSLSLSQPLFRWTNWQQYEQSKLQVLQGDALYAQAGSDLMLRLAQAYFDVLAAQDNMVFIDAQKKAITEQLEQAKRNFEVGTATITDQQEAQARYDLNIAQEIAAQNELQNKQNTLRMLVGQDVTQIKPLNSKVQLQPPEPAVLEAWLQSAEQQNYAVQIQQIVVEIATREIEKAKAGHYPTLDLTASSNKTRQSSSVTTGIGSESRNNQIGVQWNIPIFAGGATQSKVRESIALKEKAAFELQSAQRTATQNARTAYTGVLSGLAQIRALQAAEKSSQLALESNKLGYEVGVRINIDVLNAQQQLFQTRRDLAKARYDTLLNGLRLKAAAGTLKEVDLQAVNGLLE